MNCYLKRNILYLDIKIHILTESVISSCIYFDFVEIICNLPIIYEWFAITKKLSTKNEHTEIDCVVFRNMKGLLIKITIKLSFSKFLFPLGTYIKSVNAGSRS